MIKTSVSNQEAMQRHHDYYAQLFKEGRLTPADQAQYELAMQREQARLVQPLPHGESSLARHARSNEAFIARTTVVAEGFHSMSAADWAAFRKAGASGSSHIKEDKKQ